MKVNKKKLEIEHEALVNILKHGTKVEQQKEAERQEKELHEIKRKKK